MGVGEVGAMGVAVGQTNMRMRGTGLLRRICGHSEELGIMSQGIGNNVIDYELVHLLLGFFCLLVFFFGLVRRLDVLYKADIY